MPRDTGPYAGRLRDLAAVLGLLLLSATVAVLALSTARGVVSLGNGSYSTESVSGWWWLAFLLVPLPAAIAGRRGRGVAAAAIAALVVPTSWPPWSAWPEARYRASGWSDGLEGLAFLHPALLALLARAFVAAVRRRA